MNIPKITNVEAQDNLILKVKFADGQIKEIDIKPYLKEFKPFEQLLNKSLFNNVHVDCGGLGIVWDENIDLSRYDIWEFGISVQQ